MKTRRGPARQDLREVQVTCTVAAARPRVFAAVADPAKPFLTSNPFTTVAVVGTQTTGVGTIYRWTFTLARGLGFTFDEVVTQWLDNERFSYRALSGWTMEATHVLADREAGTHITFTLRYRPPRWATCLVPRWLVGLGIRRALANVRRRVE